MRLRSSTVLIANDIGHLAMIFVDSEQRIDIAVVSRSDGSVGGRSRSTVRSLSRLVVLGLRQQYEQDAPVFLFEFPFVVG